MSGISSFKVGYVQVEYNFRDFTDSDYADARRTRAGPFVTLRFKFDQTTLEGLSQTSARRALPHR